MNGSIDKILYFSSIINSNPNNPNMKKTLFFLGICALMCSAHYSQAQRYSTEIYTSNQLDSDVLFGVNVNPFSIPAAAVDPAGWGAEMAELNAAIDNGDPFPAEYFIPTGAPGGDQTLVKLQELRMDVYTPPAEDDVEERPLIIFIHTGNFLPPLFNGGITGDKVDSAGVNLCRQWARRGFVAANINYRLGWNPTSTDPDVRRGTLLQAVYRALHDTQSAVRFMRNSVDEGNPYGIDPDKIVLFGQGSGGYVAQAYATLDDYFEEIAGLDKFVGNNGPYVVESVDGTIDGGPGFTRLPDPLQEAGISKEISMSANAGGALADISWLDAGEPPMVTIHCIRDPFAPFDDGTVVVPTTNENVVDVSGGNVFIQQAVDLGNNFIFETMPSDPFTDRARSLYGQTFDYILPTQPEITVSSTPEGLFPVLLPINEPVPGTPFFNQSGPWDWWDLNTLEVVVAATNAATGQEFDAQELHNSGVLGNPDMGPEKGLAYIDTIQGYTVPRIMCALQLEGAACGPNSTTEQAFENSTQVYPNPTQGELTVRNDEYFIQRVELMDITGRVVFNEVVNTSIFTLNRNDFSDGVYLLNVFYENERVTKKILFN
jgi:acetyl esterase/lipase